MKLNHRSQIIITTIRKSKSVIIPKLKLLKLTLRLVNKQISLKNKKLHQKRVIFQIKFEKLYLEK